MAINPTYGMGVYNSRYTVPKLSLPRTAGGVATPLAFFPSSNVQRGDVTESLDTSLADMISAAGGGSDGGGADPSNSPAGSSTSGRADGFGLSSGISSAVGKGVSTGLGFAGAPAAVAGLAGGLATGIAGKGISSEDMANLAMNAVAVALGVPGVAMTGLQALGFNPAQGLAEALGLSNTTPGFEGGFFGTPGLGLGIEGSISDTGVDSTPSGFGVGDLGGGISTGATTGISGGISVGFDSLGMSFGSGFGDPADTGSFGGGFSGMSTESSYGDVSASNDSNTSSDTSDSDSDSDSDSY